MPKVPDIVVRHASSHFNGIALWSYATTKSRTPMFEGESIYYGDSGSIFFESISVKRFKTSYKKYLRESKEKKYFDDTTY